MTSVPIARVSSHARSIVFGPTHVAYVVTVSRWRWSAASIASTCASVAQSGLRCAPQMSTPANPSAATSASSASIFSG